MGRGGDLVASVQIDEMGKDVARSGGQQGRFDIGIDGAGQGRDVLGAGLKRLQDRGLAGAAVIDQPCEAGGWIGDWIAVAGVKGIKVAREGALAGGHEIGQIAIGGRDDRGRPAHDQITAKGEVIGRVAGRVFGCKAEVIAEMARCPEGLKRP